MRRKKERTNRPTKPSSPSVSDEDLIETKRSKPTDHRSVVIYGRSGTGKTTLSCSFPDPILLIDVNDLGTDSVRDLIDDTVDSVDATVWSDLEEFYWYLKKRPDKYKTLVIDTVSQMQQLAIEKVLTDAGKSTAKAGEWGSMTKKDWGEVASLMKNWLVMFRDLPMNVVFVAQDRTFNLGDEGDEDSPLNPEVGPRLSPAVASALNAAVHIIANTFIRQTLKEVKVERKGRRKPLIKEEKVIEYCLRIGPNPTYVTKVRKPKGVGLPEVITNPSYKKLIKTLKGE